LLDEPEPVSPLFIAFVLVSPSVRESDFDEFGAPSGRSQPQAATPASKAASISKATWIESRRLGMFHPFGYYRRAGVCH